MHSSHKGSGSDQNQVPIGIGESANQVGLGRGKLSPRGFGARKCLILPYQALSQAVLGSPRKDKGGVVSL